MKRWASIASLVCLLVVGSAGAGLAQQAKKRQPRVIQLEEIVIEGRVQKPNAFYISSCARASSAK
jgi:hypothetical protein